MSLRMPITLIGDNLGDRHKYLNTLVREAYNGNEDLTSIQQVSEKTPVDRLFKIDLASKRRDVNYIIENLKDYDILYVSRALKSKWLLDIEYKNIINPVNLEENFFPHMITTAVRKMKHWIHLNLKDNRRSEEFYKFYCDKEFELAIKFLVKSSKEFIEQEFSKIIYKVSPRQFKLLCETCYQVAIIFFDSLSNDERLKSQYLEYHKEYFESLKFLLKTDPNTFFDIVEKYFNVEKFEKFSPNATKLVIQKHKDRFLKKPELYAVWLLDMKTLATNLNAEEAKELVEKLARAKYVRTWFSYKNVEPLIKRLKLEERAVFKKKIFVEKDVGQEIADFPYIFPSPFIPTKIEPSIFDDLEHSPSEYYDLLPEGIDFRCMLKKRKYAKWGTCQSDIVNRNTKTDLDQLFDKYRFVGFDKTLFELRNQIKAESSKERRQYMILVLVSKAGGRIDALANLLELLVTHRNEPSNFRATVVRSLVKRSFVWRLPDETWQKLLDFAYNLGLDGKSKECECVEGLHAVILRYFLSDTIPDAELFGVFLTNFTTFSKYSLSCEEKIKVSNILPKALLAASRIEEDIPTAVVFTEKLLNTLDVYKIPVSTYPGLITHTKYLAEKDLLSTNPLLERLYKGKVARKQLFEINFKLFKSDESYLNALRHKANIIQKDAYQILYKTNKSGKFFRKLEIYFNEENGIGQPFLKTWKLNIISRNLVRPALLTKDDIISIINNVEIEKNIFGSRKFVAAIKANAYAIRPLQKLETLDWESVSTKLIANRVITCRQKDVENCIKELLKHKKTMGLALTLSNRSVNKNDVFTTVSQIRPTKIIKTGLAYIRKESDIDWIWKIIKPLIENLDLTSISKQYLLKHLTTVDDIPLNIKAEYNKIIFQLRKSNSYYQAMPSLCHIENLLPNKDEDFIEKVLYNWLTEYFVPDKLRESLDYLNVMNLHIRILVKHILFSETEEVQNHRLNTLGQTFFDQLKAIWNRSINEKNDGKIVKVFFDFLKEILLTLKFTKVFIDHRYQSCLPVMSKFETWLKTIVPFEKNFDLYFRLRLTMMYYNALKQSLEDNTDIFVNEKNKSDGTRLVGYNFGKHIALEVNDLCNKYFESIIDLYKDSFFDYLNEYFCTVDLNFIGALIEGIFDNGVNSILILGVYLLKHNYYYEFNNETKDKITSSLKDKNVKEVIFFLNSSIY